tara:strand:- start:105 stop:779 length:675 start_codon:yes stop_codon:yes gene_type:complete
MNNKPNILRNKLSSITNSVDQSIIFPLFRKKKLSQKLKEFDKLNIGCGQDLIPGWLNIGLFTHKKYPYGLIFKKLGSDLLKFNLSRKIPIKRNSISYIYASHFIEHLSPQDGIKFINSSYNYLKKGGIIRLTFPDLELWIKNYQKNNLSFFKRYNSFYSNNNKTKGGHKWTYDFESISYLLKKAGFSQIKRKKAFDSLIPKIKLIEPNRPGRLLETCYVEAIKL